MEWEYLMENDGSFAELIRALELLRENFRKMGITNPRLTQESEKLLKRYLNYAGNIVDPELVAKAVLFIILQHSEYKQRMWKLLDKDGENMEWLSLSPVIEQLQNANNK